MTIEATPVQTLTDAQQKLQKRLGNRQQEVDDLKALFDAAKAEVQGMRDLIAAYTAAIAALNA